MCHQWWDYQSCRHGKLLFHHVKMYIACLLKWSTRKSSFTFPFIYYFYIFLQFFDMPRHDAVKALNIYKRAGKQVFHSHTFQSKLLMLHRDIVGSRLLLCCFDVDIPIKLNFSNFFPFIQAENLADFYEFCKGLDLARHFQFPTLRQVPVLYLHKML